MSSPLPNLKPQDRANARGPSNSLEVIQEQAHPGAPIPPIHLSEHTLPSGGSLQEAPGVDGQRPLLQEADPVARGGSHTLHSGSDSAPPPTTASTTTSHGLLPPHQVNTSRRGQRRVTSGTPGLGFFSASTLSNAQTAATSTSSSVLLRSDHLDFPSGFPETPATIASTNLSEDSPSQLDLYTVGVQPLTTGSPSPNRPRLPSQASTLDDFAYLNFPQVPTHQPSPSDRFRSSDSLNLTSIQDSQVDLPASPSSLETTASEAEIIHIRRGNINQSIVDGTSFNGLQGRAPQPDDAPDTQDRKERVVDAYITAYGEPPFAREAAQLAAVATQGMLATPRVQQPTVFITSESPGDQSTTSSTSTSTSPAPAPRAPRPQSEYFTPTSLNFQDPSLDPQPSATSPPASPTVRGPTSRFSDDTEAEVGGQLQDVASSTRHIHDAPSHLQGVAVPPSSAATPDLSTPSATSEGLFDPGPSPRERVERDILDMTMSSVSSSGRKGKEKEGFLWHGKGKKAKGKSKGKGKGKARLIDKLGQELTSLKDLLVPPMGSFSRSSTPSNHSLSPSPRSTGTHRNTPSQGGSPLYTEGSNTPASDISPQPSRTHTPSPGDSAIHPDPMFRRTLRALPTRLASPSELNLAPTATGVDPIAEENASQSSTLLAAPDGGSRSDPTPDTVPADAPPADTANSDTMLADSTAIDTEPGPTTESANASATPGPNTSARSAAGAINRHAFVIEEGENRTSVDSGDSVHASTSVQPPIDTSVNSGDSGHPSSSVQPPIDINLLLSPEFWIDAPFLAAFFAGDEGASAPASVVIPGVTPFASSSRVTIEQIRPTPAEQRRRIRLFADSLVSHIRANLHGTLSSTSGQAPSAGHCEDGPSDRSTSG